MENSDWQSDKDFGVKMEKIDIIEDKIKRFFPDAEQIISSTLEEDKNKGIDKWVKLTNGKLISISIKTRRSGVAAYWKSKDDSELALETWSVISSDGQTGLKKGWTVDNDIEADYILFHFEDIEDYYLYPFEVLKRVFIKNKKEWCEKYSERRNKKSKDKETGKEWYSQWVPVPTKIVWEEITKYTHYKE